MIRILSPLVGLVSRIPARVQAKLLGAFLTIAFLWMLHMELVPQILLGGITAFFLGIMIFLIYAMDHPLQGAVSVPPDSSSNVAMSAKPEATWIAILCANGTTLQ